MQAHRIQIRNRVDGRALVHAEALGHHVDIVEEVVLAGRGLVDRADDGVAVARQFGQQLNQMLRRRTVQATAKKETCKDGIRKGESFVAINTYEVGSSRNRTGGLSSNSKATERRFRCPPDRSTHFVLRV